MYFKNCKRVPRQTENRIVMESATRLILIFLLFWVPGTQFVRGTQNSKKIKISRVADSMTILFSVCRGTRLQFLKYTVWPRNILNDIKKVYRSKLLKAAKFVESRLKLK